MWCHLQSWDITWWNKLHTYLNTGKISKEMNFMYMYEGYNIIMKHYIMHIYICEGIICILKGTPVRNIEKTIHPINVVYMWFGCDVENINIYIYIYIYRLAYHTFIIMFLLIMGEAALQRALIKWWLFIKSQAHDGERSYKIHKKGNCIIA